MAEWFLGTMGFGYQDWKDVFYPSGMQARDFLAHYSRNFNAVEMDTTFYGTPRQAIVRQWYATAPAGFRICAKTPKIITHEMGLVGAGALMNEFIAAMRLLEDKLGAILIQLPPSFTAVQMPVLADFLKELPVDVHYAVEFRHRSWFVSDVADVLRAHQVAWAATDFPGLPQQVTVTSDILYVRWIGQHGSYEHHTHERVDQTPQLKGWWEYLSGYLGHVQAVYGFFNNDYAGHAVGTCNKFKTIAGLPVVQVQPPRQERLL
jgi:uncharacterized protein YecE (DUF72 family)